MAKKPTQKQKAAQTAQTASNNKKTIAKQIDAALDEPLNADAPPTIYGTTLKPELATAALNLSVDFLKQQQAAANKYAAWHPFNFMWITLVVAIYLGFNTTYPDFKEASSVTSWIFQYISMNMTEIGSSFLIFGISCSIFFTLFGRIINSLFSNKINVILKTHGQDIFSLDLSTLMTGVSPNESNLIGNTHVIVYRDTPISLISIKENKDLTTETKLVMDITSLGSRKVYAKSGILEDLIKWAMLRTKDLRANPKQNSMMLLMDAYSFDHVTKEALRKCQFKMIESYKLDESRIIGGILGARKELWGLSFDFRPKAPSKN
ncbi:Pho86p SCDLUD_005109 [Saccharomycodes ludwigii]|uniref:Pho86p n=1 Tax=Saccharomycodes ludwigii TaxID=36035 RepID=UPI001E84AA0A|nr:hypothetical protein SCDLUD_005109 [Saccharomycodes ludwigii]KAH3898774.1 hypothetical protein SCDLUD_005109 [Saccharomycodes ludwigii]